MDSLSVTLSPAGDGDVIPVTANSAPTAPFPDFSSYDLWSSQTKSLTQLAWESPEAKIVLLILFS